MRFRGIFLDVAKKGKAIVEFLLVALYKVGAIFGILLLSTRVVCFSSREEGYGMYK